AIRQKGPRFLIGALGRTAPTRTCAGVDGSHYQRLQSAMHILPSFARCTIPHAASTLWRRAFRGTELLRQPLLQHLQAVLAPEQLASHAPAAAGRPTPTRP